VITAVSEHFLRVWRMLRSRKLFMLLYYSTHVQWQRMWSLRKCEYSGLDRMEGGAEAGGVVVYVETCLIMDKIAFD